MRSVGCALTLQRQRASGLVIAPPARTLNAGRTHAPLVRSEFTMFKRFSLLWALIRGDARLLWRALRHPQSPGWLKLGALVRYIPVSIVVGFTNGIAVLIASAKAQMLDLGLYRYLGIEPARMKLLVNKSSVHFRAAFGPIASHILVAKSPGPVAADPGDLPWTNLPAGMATRP